MRGRIGSSQNLIKCELKFLILKGIMVLAFSKGENTDRYIYMFYETTMTQFYKISVMTVPVFPTGM